MVQEARRVDPEPEADENGHVWSDGRCDRCWCECDWPLAKQTCPLKAKGKQKNEKALVDDEERRRQASEYTRTRRALMDPEQVRAQNREYKRRQRERERLQRAC